MLVREKRRKNRRPRYIFHLALKARSAIAETLADEQAGKGRTTTTTSIYAYSRDEDSRLRRLFLSRIIIFLLSAGSAVAPGIGNERSIVLVGALSDSEKKKKKRKEKKEKRKTEVRERREAAGERERKREEKREREREREREA